MSEYVFDQFFTAEQVLVIVLVATGLTDKQISSRLHVSPSAVGSTISAMIRRLELHSRAELVAYAYAAGMLRPAVWPPTALTPQDRSKVLRPGRT